MTTKKRTQSGNIVTSVQRELEKYGVKAQKGSEILSPMVFVSTGSLALNQAIGRPGYPCGMITEIVGHTGSGKSLLCLIAAGVVTRRGKYALLLDNEGNHGTKETAEWLDVFGINRDFLIRIPPDFAEKSMEASLKVLRKLQNQCQLVIVDSVNAFVPERVAEKEMGDSTIAVNAKLLHEWFDKLRIVNHFAAVLVINQHTSKIGYGNPVTKGGGYAMKYDPHVSVEVKGSPVYDADSDVDGAKGMELDLRVVKNKVGPQGRVAKCKISYVSGGFDLLEEVVTMAVDRGIIKKSAPYYYIGEKSFQGRAKIDEYLRGNKKLLARIVMKLGYEPKDLGL